MDLMVQIDSLKEAQLIPAKAIKLNSPLFNWKLHFPQTNSISLIRLSIISTLIKRDGRDGVTQPLRGQGSLIIRDTDLIFSCDLLTLGLLNADTLGVQIIQTRSKLA